MTASYQIAALAHATAGALALAVFWTAAVMRKGSRLHRRAGQVYLLLMLGLLATALPLVLGRWQRGQVVVAVFLAYLVVLTAATVWCAWRAIRDKRDVDRYTGPVYLALAAACAISGAVVLALGIHVGSMLLIGFSMVGLVAGGDMVRKRRGRARLAAKPQWWLREHYAAMLGNGVATHIAFLAVGLPRLLPAIDASALRYLAWFGPLVVALAVRIYLDRRMARGRTLQSMPPMPTFPPPHSRTQAAAAPVLPR